MARMDDHEQAVSEIDRALKAAEKALKKLTSAEPLGKTARVLNPRQRLLDGLAEVCHSLKQCHEEYGVMLEAAVIEQDRAAR